MGMQESTCTTQKQNILSINIFTEQYSQWKNLTHHDQGPACEDQHEEQHFLQTGIIHKQSDDNEFALRAHCKPICLCWSPKAFPTASQRETPGSV